MSATPVLATEPAFAKRAPTHVLALDGLRGLAILLVLSNHLTFVYGPVHNPLIRITNAISQAGWAGVDLFFVLSGFLITGILLDSVSQDRFFRNFYMRRILRICPLYYGYLFVLVLLTHPLHIAWRGRGWIFFLYLQNTFIAWSNSNFSVLTGHLWSLSVEEQFYVAWPLLVFFIRDRRRLMHATLILAILSVCFRGYLYHNGLEWDWIYRLTVCRMETLLVGGFSALSLRGKGKDLTRKLATPIFLFLAVALFVIHGRHPEALQRAAIFCNIAGYSMVAVAAGSLLVMSVQVNSLSGFIFRNSLLRWFGKYSYGIYVLHRLCLLVVTRIVYGSERICRFLRAYHSVHIVIVAVSISSTLALTWCSFNFYEAQFLKLKKYFTYGRQSRQPVLGSGAGFLEAITRQV